MIEQISSSPIPGLPGGDQSEMSKLHPVPSQMDTINALLQRKLANPLDDTLNDEFLSHTITFFTSNGTDCMWCKSPRITSELLWLFSLNDNDHLEWFKRVTTKCLQQCRACIEAYYKHRSMIMHRFRSIYNPEHYNSSPTRSTNSTFID